MPDANYLVFIAPATAIVASSTALIYWWRARGRRREREDWDRRPGPGPRP